MTCDEATIEAALGQLDLEQRVRLLTGADFWSLYAEPAIGLRVIVVSDGPSGVRGATWDERSPSLNLPSATALAAAWDVGLAYRYGEAMAGEARRKGVDVVLGPTINLHRSPLGGRHFEAYSEDPMLTGAVAEAFVRGLQDHGVGACPKHYVANDFETERRTASVSLSDRALRELYLAPFERAVVDGGAWTVMSSYNAVRGITMTENDLLRSPLCDEWGFDGLVISDWTAVRSVASANARQDLVMPGPEGGWGDALVEAVREGRVSAGAVAEKVRRLLRLAGRVGALGGAGSSDLSAGTGAAGVGLGLAREAEASGIVLVRNHHDLLPLAGVTTIAVIGQHATRPRTQGGGSATVIPTATVSPLEGIREAFPTAQVTYQIGAVVDAGLEPLPLETMTHTETGLPGLHVKFLSADGTVVLDETRTASSLVWLGDAPANAARLVVATKYRPSVAGPVELGVAAAGWVELSVDGAVRIEGAAPTRGDDPAEELLDPPIQTTLVTMDPATSYLVRAVQDLPEHGGLRGACSLTLGTRPVVGSAPALIADAAAAARQADVAIVVVGTNEKVESEGFDRSTLSLPGDQDKLVAAVVAANPRTVVIVNSGSPVVMPWRHDAGAVLLTWFGGQEYGHAVADVLSGAAEPGGRLPTTWPGTEDDVPVIDVTPRDGELRYDEGIHIGYRAWHRAGVAPAYPFGFGLGYTTWSYEGADASRQGSGSFEVRATVRNTGPRAGREVVQVYVSKPDSAIDRPRRWLAGWAGVTAGAGEVVEATIVVPRRAFEHWDSDAGGWQLEPGAYMLGVARHVDAVEISMAVQQSG